MVQVIDTDLFPSWRRVAYLHEAMERSPLPLIDISESRFNDSNFRARFDGRLLGNAFLTRFNASSLRLRRSSNEISRRPCDMFLLAILHEGTYDQTFEYHKPFSRTDPGDLLLIDLDAPQTVTFARSASTTCAYIPREYFRPFFGDAPLLRPVLLRPQNELHPLLTACLVACASMHDPTPAAASGALSTLAQLASIAYGLDPSGHDGLKGSLAEARRQRAQQFIASRCDDPRLTPQIVADHLGVSLRSLNMAFEPTGQGVAARILSARLRWAKDMLLQFPERSVLDIAMACGFNNLTTFYRGFEAAYRAPPGTFRKTRLTMHTASSGLAHSLTQPVARD